MRTWLKRKPSSPSYRDRSGRAAPCASGRGGCRPAGPRRATAAAPRRPAMEQAPSTEARWSTARSAGSRRSMRAARSAWMVAGTASSAASGSSPSMADICSTKSGCPPPRERCDRGARAIPRSCISPSIRSIDSVSFSWVPDDSWPRRGPRRTDVEEVGTRETEEQDRRPAREAEDIPSRSSIVGSAQWMSSTTTTRGRVAASVSKSRRNARRLLR